MIASNAAGPETAYPLAHAMESLDYATEVFRDMVSEAQLDRDAFAVLAMVQRARRHVLEAADCRLRPSVYALATFEAGFRGAAADFKGRLKAPASSKVREWQILRGLAVLEEAFALLGLAARDIHDDPVRSRA